LTREKIKKLDVTKLKTNKSSAVNNRLVKYQGLLQRIKDLHIMLEEQELQQESYLLMNYRDEK